MVAEPHDISPRMTEAEYLAFEDDQHEAKHEYCNGIIYAMSGGSLNHSTITTNIITQFNIQLADRDCTVTSPDLRVHIASKRLRLRRWRSR